MLNIEIVVKSDSSWILNVLFLSNNRGFLLEMSNLTFISEKVADTCQSQRLLRFASRQIWYTFPHINNSRF